MEDTGRAAMGRFVLSTKEHLVLLRPVDGMLALQTLYYPEDVRLRDKKEIVDRLEGRRGVARTSSPWPSSSSRASPSRSTRRPTPTRRARRCWSSCEAKADGQEVAEPEEAAEPAPVIDLMAALKASLAASGGGVDDGEDGAEEKPAPKKPASRGRSKAKKADDQLDIEQSRLRKVEGGGEKPARKAPAKKPAARRRKAS